MPAVSGCSVMTGEVGVVTVMANETGAVIADGVECCITDNNCAEFTIGFGAVLETAVGCSINMTVFTVAAVDHCLYITRAVTVGTLGCPCGYQAGMGISRMRLEVAGVIDRVIAAVTIRTATGHTFTMVGGTAVCQCDKRTVGCAGMTVLAAAVRSMDNRLDIAAVACRRTVGRAGQHGTMRICCIYVIILC